MLIVVPSGLTISEIRLEWGFPQRERKRRGEHRNGWWVSGTEWRPWLKVVGEGGTPGQGSSFTWEFVQRAFQRVKKVMLNTGTGRKPKVIICFLSGCCGGLCGSGWEKVSPYFPVSRVGDI